MENNTYVEVESGIKFDLKCFLEEKKVSLRKFGLFFLSCIYFYTRNDVTYLQINNI